ncbi:OmpA family protein [Thiomicrorhabdus lithotrophica]|uniref:OmpA family protein n=1 Tax=Thiomicrorhabdus lithotrophica TaxID=2949997 RepID=A0ABY8CB34_9GAMM|nr:OmpA family protein [Thiomicrorhabdus lithotrophica]WEJ63186.1 OmpA family protein [Thiomicrorhabdus lithotrophica]
MKRKLITAMAAATLISLTAGCANDPNRPAEERETERNVITGIAAVAGALAANAMGVDNNLGKVAVGALAGYTARQVYGDVQAGTASDPNTDVSAVNIGGQEYVQVEVKDVNFRSGSAQLEPYELTRLKPVLDTLQRHPNTRVHIEGHTDSDGSNSYNQQLSENRAKNVAFHLMDNGISRDRIVTYGYGEERPIAANTTAEGKRMNRRVTFLISEI